MTERDRLNHLIYFAAVILVGYLLFQIVQPFLQPLGWAGVLAVCLQPVYQRLAARMGATKAAALSMVLVLVLIVVPVWLVVLAIVKQASQATETLQSLTTMQLPAPVTRAWQWVQERVGYLAADQLMTSVTDAGKRIVGALAASSGAVIAGVAVILVQLVITLFALVFALRDGDAIVGIIRRILPFDDPARRDRVLHEIGDLIYASVTAGLAVAATQGLIGGMAFWIVGVRAPVVWGAVMALAALIPVAGAWLVWLPVAIFMLVRGDIAHAVTLMVIGVGVISTVDNIMRPWLLSGRSSLNGLATFIALIGGASAFGFIGLVFGPVIVAIAIALFVPGEAQATS
jgi:predicted PurR-regulated permease PerM